jgi:hypothetical protein
MLMVWEGYRLFMSVFLGVFIIASYRGCVDLDVSMDAPFSRSHKVMEEVEEKVG